MDLIAMYTICTHNTAWVRPSHVYVSESSDFPCCLKHVIAGMRSLNQWRALNDLQDKRIIDALKDVL